MTSAGECSSPVSLRIGTWNLEGRSGSRQQVFLESLRCDVLLLTEVPEALDLSPWASHHSEASIRPGVRYAAVVAREVVPCPSIHPASTVAEVGGRRMCSSVLPWRSSGGEAPWSGDTLAERTESVSRAIATADLDVWGGDWNHAMQGRDWAGSRGGRAAIEHAVASLGLRVVTGALLAAGDSQFSIDHVAVPQSAVVELVERVVASDGRGRLSDHDAYIVTVQPLALGPKDQVVTCAAGEEHRWLPLVYGLPTSATFDARERGEVLLGGCVGWDAAPSERCADCGVER